MTLLVFFPAAAGAGVVAADFVVASLNGLGGHWLIAAAKRTECRALLQREEDDLAVPFLASTDFGDQQQILNGLAYGVCLRDHN